jgi:hypothetical protein
MEVLRNLVFGRNYKKTTGHHLVYPIGGSLPMLCGCMRYHVPFLQARQEGMGTSSAGFLFASTNDRLRWMATFR